MVYCSRFYRDDGSTGSSRVRAFVFVIAADTFIEKTADGIDDDRVICFADERRRRVIVIGDDTNGNIEEYGNKEVSRYVPRGS